MIDLIEIKKVIKEKGMTYREIAKELKMPYIKVSASILFFGNVSNEISLLIKQPPF